MQAESLSEFSGMPCDDDLLQFASWEKTAIGKKKSCTCSDDSKKKKTNEHAVLSRSSSEMRFKENHSNNILNLVFEIDLRLTCSKYVKLKERDL